MPSSEATACRDELASPGDFDSLALRKQLRGMLAAERMGQFSVEQREVTASEVLGNPEATAHLQQYRRRYVEMEASGGPCPEVANINTMITRSGAVPTALAEQDQPGDRIEAQSRFIAQRNFMQAISESGLTEPLDNYGASTRHYLSNVARIMRGLQTSANLLRRTKLKNLNNSFAELDLLEKCFGVVWPPGVDLYGILREMYPAFHARMAQQVPLALAEQHTELFDHPIDRQAMSPLHASLLDRRGMHLGIVPTLAVPEAAAAESSAYVAQDQLGRRALVLRLLEDVVEQLGRSPDRPVLVVDYAGGVGSMAELLMRAIYAYSEPQMRARLLQKVRVVVLDVADGQLMGGQRRFATLAAQSGLSGIDRKVSFVRHNMATSAREVLARSASTLGIVADDRPIHFGMTAYTLGALNTVHNGSGMSAVDAVSDQIAEQCVRFYATDFSSPAFRLSSFMKDTGSAGRAYMRMVHGVPEPEDADQTLPAGVRAALFATYGTDVSTAAQYLARARLAPGLASHFMTVWPNRDGHSAGYSVQPDGTLAMPAIMRCAERLQRSGAQVRYRSVVNLFTTIDVAPYGHQRRAWGIVPGWVGDFLVSDHPAADR